MEVAVIDWKDSIFVKDDNLENINAPQWVDFSAPDESVNNEAWFCRPDCNHPKTIDDFLKVTPTSKIQRSAIVSEILPFRDQNRRDAALKKRDLPQPSISLNKESKFDRLVEDGENQNPNLSTPPNHKAKFMKEAIKSSIENKKQVDSFSNKEETPKLKRTLSARNLFAGRDILNQITDFCTELKRLALRAKERENVEGERSKKSPVITDFCTELKRLSLRAKERENVERESGKKSPVATNKLEVKECADNSRVLDERKPLLEVVSKEKYEAVEKSNVKEKLKRKKRNDEAENTPIRVDVKNIRCKEVNLSQIRTYPPSPQCFSAQCGAIKATTPMAFRARPQVHERGILQELEKSNKDATHEREAASTLDVFWFLKPCHLSG